MSGAASDRRASPATKRTLPNQAAMKMMWKNLSVASMSTMALRCELAPVIRFCRPGYKFRRERVARMRETPARSQSTG